MYNKYDKFNMRNISKVVTQEIKMWNIFGQINLRVYVQLSIVFFNSLIFFFK